MSKAKKKPTPAEPDIANLKRKNAVVARDTKTGSIRVWGYPIGAKGKDHASFRATYKRIMTAQIRDKRPDLEIL